MSRILKFFVVLILVLASQSAPAITPYLPFFSAGQSAAAAAVSTDWSQRVVANGGAVPSQNTIQAAETFRLGVIAAGLSNKMYSVNIVAPDSLIATMTPLFKAKGYDPWWNTNFVLGDLTVAGLRGNGTNKFLDTGVKAKLGEAVSTNGCGLTVLISESWPNSSTAETEIGHYDGGTYLYLHSASRLVNAPRTGFIVTSTGNGAGLDYDLGRYGYLSGNAVSGVSSLYEAYQGISHVLLDRKTNTITPSISERTLFCFAQNNTGTADSFSRKRLSFVAIHAGLTESESSTFYDLIRALRISLGGGQGDTLTDWNGRLTQLGLTVSSNTTWAVSNFLYGLETNQILFKMQGVNCFVPDSLATALVPVIYRMGFSIWTNGFFGSTNLTVNGLQGNGVGKYLNTGIVPNSYATAGPIIVIPPNGFGSNSAGLSILLYNVPSSAATCIEFGTLATGLGWFLVGNYSSAINFYCWGTSVGLTALTAPTINWAGFYSGNRTSSTNLDLYLARNGTAHYRLATSSNSTATAFSIYPLLCMAYNNDGSPNYYSDRTISFAAVHAGLTQTQSSNLWYSVANLRTNLGGGSP